MTCASIERVQRGAGLLCSVGLRCWRLALPRREALGRTNQSCLQKRQ